MIIGLKRGTVKLIPYDSQWIKLFEKEKSLLLSTLNNYIIEIQHIGSTSIPDIVAKPILDIIVGIKQIDNLIKVEKIADLLDKLGYEWRKKNSHPDHHIFAKGPEEKRTVYLHLVEYEGEIWKNDLLFRDYLSKNPKIRLEYENLKKELAVRYADDREKYTKGKRPFMTTVLKRARNL